MLTPFAFFNCRVLQDNTTERNAELSRRVYPQDKAK